MIKKRIREFETRQTIERFMAAAIQSGKDWEEAAEIAAYATCEISRVADYVLRSPRWDYPHESDKVPSWLQPDPEPLPDCCD